MSSSNLMCAKDIVYIVTLVDRIRCSYEAFLKKLRDDIKEVLPKMVELNKYKKYFKAIRSAIIAHPLETVRHPDFGMNGDLIFTDLANKKCLKILFCNKSMYFNFSVDGLKEGKNENHNRYLHCYSHTADKSKYFKIYSFDVEDILMTARLYIESLYNIDEFCCKIKNEEFFKQQINTSKK